MKKTVKRITASIMIAGTLLAFTSCDDSPEKHVKVYSNDFVMEKYINGLESYESTSYEEIVFTLKYFDIGPHEPRYRGIIYLSEEDAAELMDKYEWAEVTPEFEFDEVDVGSLDGPWYRCSQFDSDAFNFVNVNYAVFNGEAIVYDIQTT